MKILYDNIIFDLQKAGGISNVWYNLIRFLKQKNDISLNFVEVNSINNLFRSKLNIIKSNIINDCQINHNLRRFMKVKNDGYDIYHSSYFRPLKQKGTTRVVVTVHDFIYEKYSGFFSRKIHVYLKKRALKQADAVICVSENTREDFHKYYSKFKKKNIYMVHNGVDDVFFPISKKDNIIIQNITLKKYSFLLYVGNRGYCKNFDFVLRLMTTRKLIDKELKLICVGGGKPNKEEIAYMKKLNVYDNLEFLSNISSQKLNILYNYAFCLLFPSIYEGFGIPAVEAMKSGCPIWCSNSSSIKELIGKNYPTSFDPTNWDQAFQAFLDLCNDNIRDIAIKVGIDRAFNFSWEKCADETLAVYSKLYSNE